ncbi:uncharacterized protein LOC144239741 isoform X2 [Crocuta crocuta]
MRTRVRWRARAPSRMAPHGTPLPASGARAAPSACFVEPHSRSPWSRTRSLPVFETGLEVPRRELRRGRDCQPRLLSHLHFSETINHSCQWDINRNDAET